MSAPTHYKFYHEEGFRLYEDRPIDGPDAAIEVSDSIVREHSLSPVFMLGSTKFMDFEQLLSAMRRDGYPIVAAEPFVHNETNYDEWAQHRMYNISDGVIFSTNAGQHVYPTGLKILYDQLRNIGTDSEIKAALAEGVTVSSEDCDDGDGIHLRAKESEARSDVVLWYKIGGKQCVLQIQRHESEKFFLLATHN